MKVLSELRRDIKTERKPYKRDNPVPQLSRNVKIGKKTEALRASEAFSGSSTEKQKKKKKKKKPQGRGNTTPPDLRER